jgi:hypothetical protein
MRNGFIKMSGKNLRQKIGMFYGYPKSADVSITAISISGFSFGQSAISKEATYLRRRYAI